MKKTLESFVREISTNNLQSNIEVCVSDNASSDHTIEVLKDLSSRADFIRWCSNEANVGYQENTVRVTRFARTDWVYVISDDDSIVSGRLKELVALCSASKELIIFNCDTGDGFESPVLEGIESKVFTKAEEVLQAITPFHLSFTGNLMFRRQSLIDSLCADDLRSAYPLTIAAWRIFQRSGALLRDMPVIVGNHENRNWLVWQPVFTAIDMAKILTDQPLSTCRSATTRRVYAMLLRSIPRAVYRIRKGQLKNASTNPFRDVSLRNVLKCYSRSVRSQAMALMLFEISNFIPRRWLGNLLNESGADSLNGCETTIS